MARKTTHAESDPMLSLLLETVDKVVRSRDAKRYNWPGVPLNQIDLMVAQARLDVAIRDGILEIVERPRVTDPTRMAQFVRRVGA